MKTKLILLIVSILIISCRISKKNILDGRIQYHDIELSKIDTSDYLIVVSKEVYELGVPFAFINSKKDTIIPMGKYHSTYTDTLKTYAIVNDRKSGMIGIDRNENILFDVFIYDNGPDYTKEGLFRVTRNGKIGYANEYGEVVIPCQFDCAVYFENGKAKVSKKCERIKVGEYHKWESESWYYIDKTGKRIK